MSHKSVEALSETATPVFPQSFDQRPPDHPASQGRSSLTFFLLVFLLSIPFLLLGSATSLQLLPGLPLSALMTFCPALAAVILVYREHTGAGVRALLKRSCDYARIPTTWYVPTVLLVPAVMLTSYGLMRALEMPLPQPKIPLLPALALTGVFFITALGEELGWSGYAIDQLQARWNALQASLIVGVIWAIWHIVPLLQVERSASWIAGWCCFTVAARVIIVWLYNNTGRSVFAAALFHDTINLSWQLFPNNGSHYDPRISGLLMALVAVIIVVLWGPRTLAHYKTPRRGGYA